jgi:ankyrin repeat protein
LQNNPDLKVVLDFTAIDLSAVNLSLCPNLHKMYLKLSPSQIETHLTPVQKAQREEAFRAAVEAENRQEMERWLNCGVDVNAAHPETGRTALMSACYKSCRLELVEYLLEQGANPNLRSARGWCIIRSVIQDIQHDAAYRDIAKCLLQHGAILEPASAMILAIAEQNEAIFEQAIAACSPEALHAIEPATNQTLLHTAVGLKSLLFIDKLVTTYQFDPFEMNDKEQNAFYFAVKAVSYECLSRLFEGVGEGEQRDTSAPFALAVRSYFDSLQSKTPDIYARHAIYFHMLQLFEQKGCQPTLEAAIALKQEAVVIQHWRGNLTDAQRSQVLQKIVLTSQLELLNALLGQRIQPNLNVREPVTGTLLHVACRQGNLAMMKFLHDEGAELNPSQQADQKALAEPLLITAIRCQRHHIVRWLLQKKMDVEQMHNGRTALQEAARINDVESISLLLQADANVMQKAENADWTALDYALEANALEAGRVLLEAANSHYLETLRAATVPYVPPAQGSLQAMINTGQSHWQPPANNAEGVKPESEERVSYALKR